MNYNSQSHIENNHRRHSLSHAYGRTGEYLGHVDDLDLVPTHVIDHAFDSNGTTVYTNEDGDTVVIEDGETAIYMPVYSQNHVVLGRIRK